MELKHRRTAPPAVRKAQIIDAARRCFILAGFASTKVADIAQLAGVSVGLIYRHFPDKAALMNAIVAEEARRQLIELVDPVRQRGIGARLSVDELVGVLRETIRDQDRVLLMLEVASAMMRDENLKRTAVSIQIEQSGELALQLAPVLDFEVSVDELGRRLQLLAGLATGLAMQIAVAPETETQLIRLFEESANAILSGRLA